jgi:hypothetical protein
MGDVADRRYGIPRRRLYFDPSAFVNLEGPFRLFECFTGHLQLILGGAPHGKGNHSVSADEQKRQQINAIFPCVEIGILWGAAATCFGRACLCPPNWFALWFHAVRTVPLHGRIHDCALADFDTGPVFAEQSKAKSRKP